MLKLRHLLLTGVALLALTPVVAGGPAFAGGDHQTYQNVGGWEVRYHPSANNCSMGKTFSRGTLFFVNYSNGGFNLVIANDAWKIDHGKDYTVQMVLDGSDKWSGTMTGYVQGTFNALLLNNVAEKFLVSFMKRNQVEIFNKSGEKVTGLPLNNSFAAMVSLVECLDRAKANGGQQRQPEQRRPEFST